MYRSGNHIKRDDRIFVFDITKTFRKKIIRIFYKTEKAEALGEFHDRAGFGLAGGAAFTHLFLCSNNLIGVFAANTEINRDIQSTVIYADGAFQYIQIHFL